MERDWKGPPGDSWTTPGEKSWPRPWWLLSIHKTQHSLFQIVNSHIYIDLHVICPWSCVWVACKVISFLWQISAATVSCSGQMSTSCLYIVKQFTYAAIYFVGVCVFYFKIIGIYICYSLQFYHKAKFKQTLQESSFHDPLQKCHRRRQDWPNNNNKMADLLICS